MGLLLLQGSAALNPRELFANGEQGLWLDPSQMSTLYQDSNGVTPCTAAGDPVGLILDQSRGGLSQIGADLVTNGTFAADTDWTKGANWTIGSGVATKTGGAANNLTQTIGSTAAAWYRISMDVTRSAGTLTVSLGTSGTTYAVTATGSYTFFILAGSGTQTLTLAGDSSFAGTVDNVVVRNVPGNHAYQTTSASRPTLARIPVSGRRNLLTRTEEFDNAAWTKSVATATANTHAAFDGTTTADTLEDTGSGGYGVVSQSYTFLNVAYTFAIDIRKTSGTPASFPGIQCGPASIFHIIHTTNGTVSSTAGGQTCTVTSLDSNWWRVVVNFTPTAGADRVAIFPAISSDSTTLSTAAVGTVIVSRAQLELGSTATNYQKVVATTDVTESGVSDLWHLVFDGSDDSLVTNSVDFTATDEMTLIAGVRKIVDNVAYTVICELSASLALNNGSFVLAPNVGTYEMFSKGTTQRSASAATFTAPVSNVVSGIADISSPSVGTRVNGVQVIQNTDSQGTGNYGNHVLYIGRRGGSSLPFNGHLYQLIVRGKTTPEGKLLEAEKFVSKKTGVNL